MEVNPVEESAASDIDEDRRHAPFLKRTSSLRVRRSILKKPNTILVPTMELGEVEDFLHSGESSAHRGYLLKLNRSKRWDNRWFELRGPFLLYWRTESKSQRAGGDLVFPDAAIDIRTMVKANLDDDGTIVLESLSANLYCLKSPKSVPKEKAMAYMQAWFSAVKSSAVHNTRQYLKKTQQELQMKKAEALGGGGTEDKEAKRRAPDDGLMMAVPADEAPQVATAAAGGAEQGDVMQNEGEGEASQDPRDTANRWSLSEGNLVLKKGDLIKNGKVSFGSSWKHRHFELVLVKPPPGGGRSYPVLRYFKLGTRLELKGDIKLLGGDGKPLYSAVRAGVGSFGLDAKAASGPNCRSWQFRVPATEQDADGLVGEWIAALQEASGVAADS